MAGSIFKEVTFTPQAFDKATFLEDMRKFEKLLNTMDDLSESGIIVGVYSDWLDKITEFIEKYNESEKYDIQDVLKFLNDRHRIVCMPKNESISNDEDAWIDQAKKLNQVREFDLIIASKDAENVKQLNSVDRKALKNKGAIVRPQSKELMRTILSPILGYANIVTIIDPYFHLESDKQRFEVALEIICSTLGIQHGVKNKLVIDIHTSIKPMIESKTKEFIWQKTEKWPKIIKIFEEKYGHTITINIWEEAKKENKWHDRWIITDQCGVALGKGSDVSEWTDATWGILDWDELSAIASKFNKNRQVYAYIGKVDSSEAIRERFPKYTDSRMTEEEKRIKQLEWERELKRREDERLAPREKISTSGGMKIQKKIK